jgi:hypothetical protein
MAFGLALLLTGLGRHSAWLAVTLSLPGSVLLAVSLRAFLPSGRDHGTRAQLAAFWVGGAAIAGFLGTEALIPLTLTAIHGRTLTQAGTVLTLAAFTWNIGSWAQVRACRHFSPRAICITGLLLVAVGTACIFLVAWAQTPWWISYVGWGLAPPGMGLITTTTLLVVVGLSEKSGMGEPVAGAQVISALGTALGTGIGGASIAWSVHLGHGLGPGLRIALLAMTVLALAGLLAAVRLPAGRADLPDVAARSDEVASAPLT